jgi:hypothetical protein
MKKMTRGRALFLASLMAALLFSGCSQKKPVVVAPQPAPPTATAPPPEPQATPAEQQAQTQESQPTQGTPPPDSQPTESQPKESQPAAEEKSNSTKKNANAKPATKKTGGETARNTRPKTVVKPDADAAPAGGQISPSLSHDQIARDQATTEQLLQTTEASLNGIKRQLSADEQAVAAQIRDYVNQSRQATKANDLTRAYNLALKARLLSDDLAKQH